MGYEGLEQSCLRKKKRTVVYMLIHIVLEKEERMRIKID